MAAGELVKVNINMRPELLAAYKRLGKMAGIPYSTLMRDTLMDGIREAAAKKIEQAQRESQMLSEVAEEAHAATEN